MAKTIIHKAKELIDEVGNEAAKKVFEKRIQELGDPKNFEDICILSGLKTAIDYIDGKI